MADSSTGGYLIPSGTPPLDDQALDRFFHDLFVGVTGLDPTLVRPRWQPQPGNMPGRAVNWMAQGVVAMRDDGVPWKEFQQGTEIYTLCRNQIIVNRLSFYGPSAGATEALLRDGLGIDQNREAINAQGISLVRVGDPRVLPVLLNEQWARRIDVEVTFRRLISRTYPVLSILSGEVELETDTGLVDNIIITQ